MPARSHSSSNNTYAFRCCSNKESTTLSHIVRSRTALVVHTRPSQLHQSTVIDSRNSTEQRCTSQRCYWNGKTRGTNLYFSISSCLKQLTRVGPVFALAKNSERLTALLSTVASIAAAKLSGDDDSGMETEMSWSTDSATSRSRSPIVWRALGDLNEESGALDGCSVCECS